MASPALIMNMHWAVLQAVGAVLFLRVICGVVVMAQYALTLLLCVLISSVHSSSKPQSKNKYIYVVE